MGRVAVLMAEGYEEGETLTIDVYKRQSPCIIEVFINKIKNVSKLETFLNMSTIGR